MSLKRRWPRLAVALAAVVGLALLAATAGVARTVSHRHASDTSSLTVGVPDDAANIDPVFAADPRSTEVIMNTYDTLTTYALGPAVHGVRVFNPKKVAGLVLSSLRPSGSSWKLTVRKGMTFPDGTPVDANALKFMFERNFGIKAGGGAFMYSFIGKIPNVEAVTVTGPYTLTIKTTAPNPIVPYMFALSNSTPIDASLLAKQGGKDKYAQTWVARHTAGSGPYQLSQWTPGSQIVLTANPHYWRGAPAIKTVTEKIIPQAANRVLFLERGIIDMAEGLSADEIQTLSKAKGVKIITVPSSNQLQLIMDTKTAPFTDVRVRRAVEYATPYSSIMSQVYHGRALGTAGPIPVGFPAHTSAGYPYGKQNLAKAKALLQAAGVTSKNLILKISSGSPDHEAIAVQIQAALKQIGLTVQIQKLTPAVFAEQRQKGQLGFFLNESSWWVPDPGYSIGLGYTCGAFFNYGHYCNKAVDKAYAAAVGEQNPATRVKKFHAIQRQIEADAPMVWITQPKFNLAVRDNITGYAQFNDGMVRFYYMRKH